MSTLPHEREKFFLDDLIDDCLKGREKSDLIVIVSSTYQQSEFFAREARDIAEGLDSIMARQIKIFRTGLEFDNGAKIQFQTISNPSFLRGLRPDRIIVMGSDAEFWYLATSSGAKIEAVA